MRAIQLLFTCALENNLNRRFTDRTAIDISRITFLFIDVAASTEGHRQVCVPGIILV